MDFKAQAIADLPTFVNVSEFGDTLEIDGASVACVLVNDETTDDRDGVSLLESTLYVHASDFDPPPVIRQRLTIGDRQANVLRVDEEQGILVIRLQWFDS